MGVQEFNMETKVYKSRYGEERYLKETGKNTYHLWGSSFYMRHSSEPSTGLMTMVDYEGGPFILVGNPLDLFNLPNKKVTSIEPIECEGKENCYLVLTQDIEPS